MYLSADQEAGVASALCAELATAGSATRLLVHDHNWGGSQRATDVASKVVGSPAVAGVAFHCYSGNPSAQSSVHDAFPSMDVFFTECSGTSPAVRSRRT